MCKSCLKSIKIIKIVVIFSRKLKSKLLLKIYGEGILRFIENVANKNEIIILPAYGTLLGITRDGGFIKHDTDIDLFLFFRDSKAILLIDKFKNDLYSSFKVKELTFDKSVNKIRVKIHGVPVDIYVPLLFKNKTNIYLNVYNQNRISISGTSDVFGNVFKCLVPKNYIEILNSCYGLDYNTKDSYPYQFLNKRL